MPERPILESESDFFDCKGGLRAGFGTFTGALFQSFGDDFVIYVHNTVGIEFVNFGTDFSANPIAATSRLIDHNFQLLAHQPLLPT